MANITLTNLSTATGVYENAPMALDATAAAVSVLIEDVVMTIQAEKTRWADKKANKYTVTITNQGTEPFALDASSVIAFTTDAFDPAAVEIDVNSVNVTGNSASGTAVNNGVLSLNLTQPITDAQPTVITFDVYKLGTMPAQP